MSIRATWSVFCRCAQWVGEEDTKKEAADYARSLGWKRKRVDGRLVWLCPNCEAKDRDA